MVRLIPRNRVQQSSELAFRFEFAGEHFLGIDGEESSATAGEQYAVDGAQLGSVVKRSAVYSNDAAFDGERLAERNRTKILDLHAAGERDLVLELVRFAHGLVQNGCNDAAVSVSGRANEAVVERELARVALAAWTENKLQLQPVRIGRAAAEASVALKTLCGYVVILVLL